MVSIEGQRLVSRGENTRMTEDGRGREREKAEKEEKEEKEEEEEEDREEEEENKV